MNKPEPKRICKKCDSVTIILTDGKNGSCGRGHLVKPEPKLSYKQGLALVKKIEKKLKPEPKCICICHHQLVNHLVPCCDSVGEFFSKPKRCCELHSTDCIGHKCEPLQSSSWEKRFDDRPIIDKLTGETVTLFQLLSAQQQEWKKKIKQIAKAHDNSDCYILNEVLAILK